MILALFVGACLIEFPFAVWHYAGYWNGRYDPLTPCHDKSIVSDTSNDRKDHDS